MNKEKVEFRALKLIGLTARTENKNEMEPGNAKIGPLVNQYMSEHISNNFKHRVNPSTTFCVYTEFESNEHGEYTYFIGEEVNSFDEQDTERFKTLTIELSNYQKFTTESGQMPEVIINAWQNIWQMNENDFEGKRTYIADFEIYDQRAANPEQAVVDIYIGIK